MANIKSAKKRIRRNGKRETINRNRRARLRTFLRRVDEAIKSGDAKSAQEAFKAAQPEIHRSVTKGVLHANTASRKISRLSKAVKKLAA